MVSPIVPKYAEKYKAIQVEIHASGVAVATMDAKDAGGCNLLTGRLLRDFNDMVRNIASDTRIRVLVVRSANEDFWISHLDVNALYQDPLTKEESGPLVRGEVLNEWHTTGEILRNMPKATIAEVTGRVGGGGHEFSLNFDMRFGVYGKTKICQMEVPLGITPGGGGCVNIPRFVGAGRTMEIVLGAEDIDAETAERWGLLNRCFHDVAACRAHVDALAARIASFPIAGVQEAKASILAAERLPHTEALKESLWLFYKATRTPEAKARKEAFLKLGGQTRDGELNLQQVISKL